MCYGFPNVVKKCRMASQTPPSVPGVSGLLTRLHAEQADFGVIIEPEQSVESDLFLRYVEKKLKRRSLP